MHCCLQIYIIYTYNKLDNYIKYNIEKVFSTVLKGLTLFFKFCSFSQLKI